MTEYVYLLQEREFVRIDEPTYKIGMTRQENPYDRLNAYPKGSKILVICCVEDSKNVENSIKQSFDELFGCSSQYGREYYTGDVDLMRRKLFEIVNESYEKYENLVCAPMEIEDNIETEDYTPMDVDEDNVDEDNTEDEKETEISIIKLDTIATETKIKTNSKTKYRCDRCGKQFKTKQYLSQHISRRTTPCDKKIYCTDCGKIFKDKKGLTQHKKRKTPCSPEENTINQKDDNPNNKCDKCDGTYSTPSNLKRHQKTCNGPVMDKFQMQILIEQNKKLLQKLNAK